MGAINSAFNQGLGAVAGALTIGKKLSQEKATADALKASNEVKAVELEAGELEERQNDVTGAEAAIGAYLDENPELKAVDLDERLAIEEATGDAELPNSLTKAKEALDRMESERAAKVKLRDITQKKIDILRGGKK